MKVWKRVAALAMTGVLAAGMLAGCGSKDSEKRQQEPQKGRQQEMLKQRKGQQRRDRP